MPDRRYSGRVLLDTSHYVILQKLQDRAQVSVHRKSKLDRVVKIGEEVAIKYTGKQGPLADGERKFGRCARGNVSCESEGVTGSGTRGDDARRSVTPFKLLQRYNWCLESLESYQTRWTTFWPRISAMERLLLVLLVSANCDGQFGRRVVAIESPVDFERFEGDARPWGLSDMIGSELSRVLAQHYDQFSDRAQIQDWLRIECPKEFALLVAVGGVDRALPDTGGWLEPSVLRHEGTAAFRGCGWDERCECDRRKARASTDVIL